MLLADHGIISPKEWQHDPLMRDANDCTVAMILASAGIIPPKEWEHDKFIKYYNCDNYYNYTIAEILSQ